jgi:hypothetical protein
LEKIKKKKGNSWKGIFFLRKIGFGEINPHLLVYK